MPSQLHSPLAPRITVAVADECPAMREGLTRLISDECDLAVTGSAATGRELRELISREPPKVLVMDIVLSDDDGLVLIKEIAAAARAPGIVVFTLQPEGVYAERCFRLGARAFVTKREAVTTLFRAIRETAAGGLFVPAGVSVNMFSGSNPTSGKATGFAAQLTDRELEIFRLVGLALSTRDVAARLGVSIKTIESHRENIKNKLSIGSHSELVARASEWLRETGGT
jgi:DNA-binding NarL/FixJ family response regulator